HQTHVKYLIPNRKRYDSFVDILVLTRNFLTHYGEKNSRVKTDPVDLYKMSIRLKFLLEICLLSELELPQEISKTILERISSKYKLLLNGAS
ncbi:MAG: hypothetical protein K8I30_22605, partial [Anaerolineae bacterium]|nr:hypothetical protein [Anaerolineae bacterium]